MASCVSGVDSGKVDEGIVALFNPAVSPAVVPTPTDLVRQGGALQIPVDPAEATVPALKAFNSYLRTLDGYPPDATAAASFSAAIDNASLAEGVFVYDATDKRALAANEFRAAVSGAAPNTLSLAGAQRWKGGHSYVIALLSWSEGGAVKGIKGSDGKRVIADQAFTFLRSQRPLIGRCADLSNGDCACPSLTDASCRAIVDGVGDSSARLLEGARQGIAPALDAILGAAGRQRGDVVLAWRFTVSKRPFAVFDSGRGQIPFPSDLLLANPLADLKPGATTVKLPILDSDSPLTKALKGGLNTLDGFSTTGSAQFPIDSTAEIAAASVTRQTTLFLNTTSPADQPVYAPTPLVALLDKASNTRGFAGQVWLTPTRPLLGDQNRYVGILTTGIKDTQGLPLTPAPTTVLLTQGSPLVVDGKSAVPSIPLESATQLELLRLGAVQPLLDGLNKLLGAAAPKPAQIAALTIFRTQSITAPLLSLSALPTAKADVLPTDVTFDNVIRDPADRPNVGAIIYGKLTTLQVVGDRAPLNPAGAKPKSIPFILTLPKKAATPVAKVAIVQHGIGRWRGDALAISNELAKQGMAGIAIDVIYHGGRVVCVDDNDCASGVTCAKAQATDAAGVCTGGQYKTQANESPLPGPGNIIIPDGSLPNRDFSNFGNLFAARDNFRQHVVDLSQVVRVLRGAGASSINGRLTADSMLATLDVSKLAYVGQSLGAILGTSFLAVSPDVNTGVLNVGGAPVLSIYTDPSSSFSPALTAFFKSIGIEPETPAYYNTLDNIRWIIDPGDPINLARHVRSRPLVHPLTMQANAKKQVILQESGMDTAIPNSATLRLGIELGLPLDDQQHLMGISGEGGASPANVSTFFANADHGALFNFKVPSLTAAIQTQAVTYMTSGLAGSPLVIAPPAN